MTNGSVETGAEPSSSHHITLKNADSVQSGLAGAWNWVEDHIKLVAAVAVGALLVGLGYLGFQALAGRQERLAQEAFYPVSARFQKTKEGFERAKYQKLMPEAVTPDAAKDAKPATGDLSKDYGPVMAELEQIAKDHAGTAGGAQAAILAAEVYIDYKQPDKAVALAEVPATQMQSGLLLTNLAKVVWGNALVAKGDCQTAVGIWQQVIGNKSAAYLHADVGLRSGICFEQLGQAERAAEMYRKVSSEAPESAAASTAKGFLRALEIKNNAGVQPAKQG